MHMWSVCFVADCVPLHSLGPSFTVTDATPVKNGVNGAYLSAPGKEKLPIGVHDSNIDDELFAETASKSNLSSTSKSLLIKPPVKGIVHLTRFTCVIQI